MNKRHKSKFIKATTAAAVAASVVAVAAPIAPEASSFKDVSSSHQFFDAIKSLSDRGIINGYQDGTFKPGQNLTRGQAAKIIAGVLGLDTTNVVNPNFKDIPSNHQYYGAIAALKQAGIIDGYEDGTFRQGANIQRNHVAKIIANALNLKSTNVDALPFTDVREDYKEAIAALYENKVTTGKTATKFDGASNVTRGQMAAFITRAEAVVSSTPETPQTVTFKLDDYTTASLVVNGTTYSYDNSVKSIFTEDNKEALNGASIVATVTNGVITSIDSLILNNAGTVDKAVVFKSDAIINALTINADYVFVSGLTVTGNAIVTTNVENSVELDGTTVKGDLIIDDAIFGKIASLDNKFANEEKKGPNVKLRNSKAGKVHVKRNDIAIESDSVITEITVAASVSIINVDGTVSKVTIESTAKLELTGNANIAQLLLTTAAELALKISGTVEALAVSNPAAQITVGTNLKINELTVPSGSTAAGIVSNFAAIASQIVNVIVGTAPNAGAPSTGGGGGGGAGGGGGGAGGNVQTPTPGADALAAAKFAASKLIATDYTPSSYRAVTNAVAAAGLATTDIEKLAAAKSITDAIAALVAITESTIVQSATVSTNDATENSKGEWTFVITPTTALVEGDQLIISSKDFDFSQLANSDISANTADTESVKSRIHIQNSTIPGHHNLVIYLNTAIDAGEAITVTIVDEKITNPKAGIYEKAFVIATSKDIKAKYVPVTILESEVLETYPVTFTSADGATIVVRDNAGNKVTDLSKVVNGIYSYTVTKAGYKTVEGTFTVEGAAKEVIITLEADIVPVATYPVTFTSADGATIVVRDSAGNEVTDLSKLANGIYSYTVTKAGYKTVEGTFTVEGAAKEVIITLEAEENGQTASTPILIGDSTITSGDTIKLSVTTGDTVYYTLDGSTPTTSSDSVTVTNGEAIIPVTGDGLVKLKAYAVINGGTNSSVAVIPLEVKNVTTTANVKDLGELKLALANEEITTINITEDILDITEALHVNRKVTINGEGKTLSFTTALNTLANGKRQGVLVTADDVVLNGLTVKMAGELGWQGVYGIQVYDATNVTLNNVTTVGADGGILVNGSAVELTGTTTVSGNEFGGIEVSKGTATGLSNSILTVTGTVTNDTESYGQPTVWVVTGQGTVTGVGGWKTNTTIKPDQTQYYQVSENADAPVATTANVKDLGELKLALANEEITTINITEDILDITEALHVDRKVTINGEGKTLSFTTALNTLANGKRQGVLVTADDVVLNGLTVKMAGELGWQGVYGIQVYDATNVTLNNVTTVGADGGILVNGSAVELTGTTTVSGNEFGGIEVSKGTATGLSNSILTVTGTVTNDTESYGQPTVWVVTGQGTVTGVGGWKTNTTIKPDQTQYYQVSENADAPVATTANVKNLGELKLALANEEITTINITEDILDITEALHVDRKVTINGEGKTLSFTTALNTLANGKRQGVLVTADDVVLNGLTVKMAGELGWQGVYGIQVYDATNVTLNNVTTVGADGGILVNGSAVELTGTTTVSENEFGGIEVSKGTATGLSNSILTVTGTVTNDTESYGQPTVWVVTGQGTVTGVGGWTTNTTIKPDQTQYYQATENADAPLVTKLVEEESEVQVATNLIMGINFIIQNGLVKFI